MDNIHIQFDPLTFADDCPEYFGDDFKEYIDIRDNNNNNNNKFKQLNWLNQFFANHIKLSFSLFFIILNVIFYYIQYNNVLYSTKN